MVGDGGFEPPKAKPADLQSVPFGHSGNLPYIINKRRWSWWTDSNPRPADYKSAALPTELYRHLASSMVIILMKYGFVKSFFQKRKTFSYFSSLSTKRRPADSSYLQVVFQILFHFYSTNPYFSLMRSSFSSIGSAAISKKITVAAP